MNAYFKSVNLDGYANWMYAQAQEELIHAMKFYDFINQRGGRVVLAKIDAPPAQWDSPRAVFEDTLKHEQKVTDLINALVETAVNEHDHATKILLRKRNKGGDHMTSWKCGKCGYTLEADAPPDRCPSCKEKCEFLDNTCYTPDCQYEGTDNRI